MSPSKLKSNERQAARDRKASACQAVGGGAAYNPSLGTFHTLQPLNSDTGAGYSNGRFKSIDDIDDNASSNGGGVDADCVSNNGSCSGESEDQLHMNTKDRSGSGKPGTGGTDKRDKVRGKNERKHQRQKERRAQELRDKCTSYLMSCKLEALAQKLVAMGFSQDRATMALMINDGRVEQSVAWLLEGSEGQVHDEWNAGSIPTIDISEELGQLLEIEKNFKLSRPDIERAVIVCEGDPVKAVEYLRARNQCNSTTACSQEHNSQSRPQANRGEPSASLPTLLRSSAGAQPRGCPVPQPPHPDERPAVVSREGRVCASSLNTHSSLQVSSKGYFHTRKHPNPNARSVGQGIFPSVSMKSTTHVSPLSSASNVESGLVFGFGTPDPRLFSVLSKDSAQNGPLQNSARTGQIHSCTVAQPIVAPKNPTVSSSPDVSPSSWSHGFLEGGSPSSVLHVNMPHGDMGWKGTNTPKNLMESLEFGISGLPSQSTPVVPAQTNSCGSQWNGLRKGLSNEILCGPSPNTVGHSGSPTGTSYGLFTGWGASLSPSSVDWSSGPLPNCDYRKIDWSMNALPTAVQGFSSQLSCPMLRQKNSNQWSFEGEGRFPTASIAANLPTDSFNRQCVWNVAPAQVARQDNISMEAGNVTGHEWTSPFAGKSLFSLAQAVSLPSL